MKDTQISSNRGIAVFLAVLMVLSVVAPVSVGAAAAQASSDGDGSATIVGESGSSDAASQHPSQYNDEGDTKSTSTYETDHIPPVDENYADAARGNVLDFPNVIEEDGTSTWKPNAAAALSVGISTNNIPSNEFYTVGIDYNVEPDTRLKVTPVTPAGEPIDNTYLLAPPEGSNGDAVSNIPLSEDERDHVRNSGRLLLVYSACGEAISGDVNVEQHTVVASGGEEKADNYEVTSASQVQINCGDVEPTPDAQFEIRDEDGDGTFETSEKLTFDASDSINVNGPDSDLEYDWSGDINDDGELTAHTFYTSGDYSVTLMVSNGEHSDTATKEFTVYGDNDDSNGGDSLAASPNIEIDTQCGDGRNLAVCQGGTFIIDEDEGLQFHATAENFDSSRIESYDWTIENYDGTETASGRSATQTYPVEGAYTVSVTADLDDGQTITESNTVQVNDVSVPVIADTRMLDIPGGDNLYDLQVTLYHEDQETMDVTVTFEDTRNGDTITKRKTIDPTENSATTQYVDFEVAFQDHWSQGDGDVEVHTHVEDENGHTADDWFVTELTEMSGSISMNQFDANLNDDTIVESESISVDQFLCNSADTWGECEKVVVEWGDGSTSTNHGVDYHQDLSHTYSNPGHYEVMLRGKLGTADGAGDNEYKHDGEWVTKKIGTVQVNEKETVISYEEPEGDGWVQNGVDRTERVQTGDTFKVSTPIPRHARFPNSELLEYTTETETVTETEYKVSESSPGSEWELVESNVNSYTEEYTESTFWSGSTYASRASNIRFTGETRTDRYTRTHTREVRNCVSSARGSRGYCWTETETYTTTHTSTEYKFEVIGERTIYEDRYKKTYETQKDTQYAVFGTYTDRTYYEWERVTPP